MRCRPKKVDALTISLVGAERSGVELRIVCGVVLVNVGGFENVGLSVEYAEMPNRVAYYVEGLAS